MDEQDTSADAYGIVREQRDRATQQLQDQEVQLIQLQWEREGLAQELAEARMEISRLEEVVLIMEQGKLTVLQEQVNSLPDAEHPTPIAWESVETQDPPEGWEE